MKRPAFLSPLFLLTVVIPTVLATIYFGFLAEDIYVSDSRFIVRSPDRAGPASLGALVSGGGALTGGSEENDAVREFLQSRDALRKINRDDFVARAYGADNIFILDRFGWFGNTSFEKLYQYFENKMTLEEGDSVRVMRMQIEAYTPQQAREINERLLQQSEALVNALSDRARNDAVDLADADVERAQAEARTATLALANFRDRQGIIDPEINAEVGLQAIAQLQEQLIASRTSLAQLRTYTPAAPQIPFLRTQIAELESEIARQTSLLAGGSGSLAANSGQFQELQLAVEFAGKQLAAALTNRQQALADARRKEAYVERISNPSLPDYAEYPRRVRNIIATLVLGLLTWGVLSMLLVGIREHRD